MRSSLPTENEAGTDRALVSDTLTHSPAATCSTRGSGLVVPALTAAACAPLGTNTACAPASTALTAKAWTGDVDGQGLPGLVTAGGLLPGGVDQTAPVGAVAVSGSRSLGVLLSSTRTIPQAPSRVRRASPLK